MSNIRDELSDLVSELKDIPETIQRLSLWHEMIFKLIDGKLVMKDVRDNVVCNGAGLPNQHYTNILLETRKSMMAQPIANLTVMGWYGFFHPIETYRILKFFYDAVKSPFEE